ncbi:MAG: type II toxin-antitoxin system RelE/ParE family toxin [Planctomycetaceae bacterium]|jgi:toxin ParE1/3/4|nr:type II toxin-antitoxin system RelE/ParE family toxin [Phycisphaerales bacterium]MCE2654552.1 type II toxin-antitoxin system RelE/ParE family toxin [Planctomycetaceae bacterium]
MSLRVVISRRAGREIEEIFDYIAGDSRSAAVRFLDAVDETVSAIAAHPRRWPVFEDIQHPLLPPIRRRPVIGFPIYLVFYLADEESVHVIHVIHGARDLRNLVQPPM